MQFDYLTYKESEALTFGAKLGDFLTILGSKNKELVDNFIYKNKNDYITINYSKLTVKTLNKYRKLLGYAGFDFIDTFLGETLRDEISFGLESLAISNNEMNDRINEISERFKLSNLLDKSPKLLSVSDKVKLSIVRVMITEPKVLILDNVLSLLDENDFDIVKTELNRYKSKNNIIINFTSNIEESLLGNKIIIIDKDKVLISGSTISVLNEEKLMKRLGFGLPFIVLLNKYLKDYELIKKYELTYEEVARSIWK